MVEYVTITTTDSETLKPLISSALAREKKRLALGIARTQARLAAFEETYAMTSEEFERRLHALDLTETVAFSDWRMEIETLRLLENRHQALEAAHLD